MTILSGVTPNALAEFDVDIAQRLQKGILG